MGFAMQRLLIRNISKLVSCDEGDTVYENVDLYAEDGVIRAIGPELPQQRYWTRAICSAIRG